MSANWKRDREQLLEWVEKRQNKRQEEESTSVPWGNILTVGSMSALAIIGISYYASGDGDEEQVSLESRLNAEDEEIDVEEEYLSLDEDY